MASTNSTAAAAPAGFQFPREYYFPPFFTRQTNLNTHHAQLVKWSSLVLSYCQHHRIFKLSLSPTGSSSATAAADGSSGSTEDIFHNKKLNRRLALADIREVVDFMRKDGRAEYVGGAEGGAGAGGDVVWVYWRTPEEWAALVEGWVDETAQKGTVLTLYELTEGEATRGTDFHGLDQDLLQKALNVLVKRGKAQIFGQEDSQGVKFF
ncbi:ESCRT-II complex subunit [Diaporthe amygdali]|uniref:ESCRT-II complex subunit n=1 Tax=Phomopsis amygdali TaxID=1214568 RepID=UPI0022FDCBFF|nr:ESCRT-II complex subunit [Diaporthe amygdali]KAJ0119463.1 ESCRT-II complex subunit [Diaporthe amygdali]